MLCVRSRQFLLSVLLLCTGINLSAQNALKTRFSSTTTYTGIEVGSKGVKLSVIEMGKNAKSTGAFHILKDTSVNTDFISFTDPSFEATLEGVTALYNKALNEYRIPSKRIFTVISSGVKMQAEKDKKTEWINRLISSFRQKTGEPGRQVEVVDVEKEARLSHLGIIPESRRYNTFLIDIGSGNTKGGFFPFGNKQDFRLFQLNWGTKSTANATEKRLDTDQGLINYNRQLQRVLAGAENGEIIYAVNSSGAYPLSDNIAVSGGIAWAVATLCHPELTDQPIVSVSFDELKKFCEKIYADYNAYSSANLGKDLKQGIEKEAAVKEIERVHKVFDQRALMAGAGLLLKIMRQFESSFDTKTFYLIKNGQVGWVSAYVDDVKEE